MDQLRSQLTAVGIDRIPPGWQFVHIDVPSAEERGPQGLGNVQEQHGRYLGCAPPSGNYALLDASLSAQMQNLEEIATWAPRRPDQCMIPISTGAGQYRAIGRMITLSRAADIRNELTAAWQELLRNESSTDMMHMARTLPGVGAFDPQEDPLVMVISSMAGGSGASMALDVCRLLTTVPGVVPELMSVFMFAADIFDGVGGGSNSGQLAGVRANGLAMLGEIVASQAGASTAHDLAVLGQVGVQSGTGHPVPFARVFPVSRYIGTQQTLFGEGTPDALYRGLGRGIAALMTSGLATHQFVAYDLTNPPTLAASDDFLGWGVENKAPIPWGSFGYACLSVGRDRYAEYAAQRIARSAVDRLVGGHLQPGNPASGTEQVNSLVTDQWPVVCSRLQLPVAAKFVRAWFNQAAFPVSDVEKYAHTIVQTNLSNLAQPGGQQPATWLMTVRHQMGEQRNALSSAIDNVAYAWAYKWMQHCAEGIRSMVQDATARLGLPYAGALLDQVGDHFRSVLLPAAAALQKAGPADIAAIPEETEQLLSKAKNALNNGAQVLQDMLARAAHPIQAQIQARSWAQLELALGALLTDVISPLRGVVSDTLILLERSVDGSMDHHQSVGIAHLQTDTYNAWPAEAASGSVAHVPARFDNATNEVLLTSSEDFDNQFRADIRACVVDEEREPSNDETGNSLGTEAGFTDARSVVVRQVISGLWLTSGGAKPPGGLLEQTATWNAHAFVRVPSTDDVRVAQAARFDLHARPSELLDRSRTFVARPDQSFERFCRVSLRDYTIGADITEAERLDRRLRLREALVRTLDWAKPLASVDASAVQRLHGNPVTFRYKFSDVPFGALPVGEELQETLAHQANIDPSAVAQFRDALKAESEVTKIDVFGSYPTYLPIVFKGLLAPASSQWASTTQEAGRKQFWQWRRAHPLAAALPMGEAERRAMVAGWFIGQLVGELRLPEPPFESPVEIWDQASTGWRPFPHPLLTPPKEFLATYDWLPAVLESILLAVMRAPEAPLFASLRPYELLRQLYDDSQTGPAGAIMPLSGRFRLQQWLIDGTTRSTATSRVGGDSIPERAAAATTWLSQICDLAGRDYVAPGLDGAPGGGVFSVIKSRPQASATPMFRDLAPDVHWAMKRLAQIVDEAAKAAEATPAPDTKTSGVADNAFSTPEGVTF
jgi:hypothetical protein